MADVHEWRLHLARTRLAADNLCNNGQADHPPRSHSHIPSDSMDIESSKFSMSRPKARKGLASLASYLNAHHRPRSPSAKPPWPSYGWSTLEDKHEVHKPDTESMCNAVLQHLLVNPSQELPATFNSTLLHILEDYRHLSVDRDALQHRLEAEKAGHKAALMEIQEIKNRQPVDAKYALADASSMQSRAFPRDPTEGPCLTSMELERGARYNSSQWSDELFPSEPHIPFPDSVDSVSDRTYQRYGFSDTLTSSTPELPAPAESGAGDVDTLFLPLPVAENNATTTVDRNCDQNSKHHTRRTGRHIRGFSFLPGDDAHHPVFPSEATGFRAGVPPNTDSAQKGRTKSGHRANHSESLIAPGLCTVTTRIVPSFAGHTVSSAPQGDDSGKSVATKTPTTSSRSSSLAHQGLPSEA